MDDINEWASTCEALHKNNAGYYAAKQAELMMQRNDPEAAAFWTKVSIEVEQRKALAQKSH